MRKSMETYETSQPWVIYRYGLTHDKWWPFWNSTRVLGKAKIICECMVCGDRSIVSIKMPRTGPVPTPPNGVHVERQAYLDAHAHPDRGAPMSWAKPMMNMAAHPGGLNLDGLAMRLEADMNEGRDE